MAEERLRRIENHAAATEAELAQMQSFIDRLARREETNELWVAAGLSRINRENQWDERWYYGHFFPFKTGNWRGGTGASGPTVYIVRSAKIFNFLAWDLRSKKVQQMKSTDVAKERLFDLHQFSASVDLPSSVVMQLSGL
jgi:hypothetical protein